MNTLNEAIRHFGTKSQMEQTAEECLELALALRHHLTGKVSGAYVVTELADVEIMLEQMALIFGRDDIDAEKQRKIARLEQRILNNELPTM